MCAHIPNFALFSSSVKVVRHRKGVEGCGKRAETAKDFMKIAKGEAAQFVMDMQRQSCSPQRLKPRSADELNGTAGSRALPEFLWLRQNRTKDALASPVP